MKKNIEEKIEIPQGVIVQINKSEFAAKGPHGEVSKKILWPKVNIEIKDNIIVFSAKKATKREKRMLYTYRAHVKSMLQGVAKGFVYKLKMCASHFPMTATVKDGEFVLQNFLGEKTPRKFKLMPGVDVKVEKEVITVKSADKELAGQTAASIEQLCRITDKDRRIFQDGIYIISKAETQNG